MHEKFDKGHLKDIFLIKNYKLVFKLAKFDLEILHFFFHSTFLVIRNIERLNKLKTKSPSKNIDIWVLFMCSGDIRESFKEDVPLSTNNNNDEHYSVYDKNLNWLHDVEISEIDYQFDKFLEE